MKLSMKDKDFLNYWLYVAFPNCFDLQQYFLKHCIIKSSTPSPWQGKKLRSGCFGTM